MILWMKQVDYIFEALTVLNPSISFICNYDMDDHRFVLVLLFAHTLYSVLLWRIAASEINLTET